MKLAAKKEMKIFVNPDKKNLISERSTAFFMRINDSVWAILLSASYFSGTF